nr:helix-turn-helix transcriptional regulator [uncultured Roseateles sp.]
MKILVYRASQGGIEVAPPSATGALILEPPVQLQYIRKGRPGVARRMAAEAAEGGAERAQDARRTLAAALQEHQTAPLAALRLAAGLSQAQVTELTQIMQPQLSRLENGRTPNPGTDTVNKLCRAYGVDQNTFAAALRETLEQQAGE